MTKLVWGTCPSCKEQFLLENIKCSFCDVKLEMTKKHHPHNRAERLVLKELDEKPKANRAAKVWRKLSAESLKEWETRHELEQVAHSRNPEGKHS